MQAFCQIERGAHKGERCFIVASGPSIKQMDLSVLKSEVTICVNESYKALDWSPDYLCIADRELWPRVKEYYIGMDTKLVCSGGLNGTCGAGYGGENMVAWTPLNRRESILKHGFTFDMRKPMRCGFNVIPEIAIPFAVWCGFSEIYLIGCDCTDDGYFYNDTARPGWQKVLPQAMRAYDKIAKTNLPANIYNATVGGRLESFPRVEFTNIFNTKNVDSNLIVIGFYTGNCDYKDLAENMQRTVTAQGLPCEIMQMPSVVDGLPKPMPWVYNCALCPEFILAMMERYPDKHLLYLDADATMERRPALFLDEEIDYDFAGAYLTNKAVNNELQSSTLFFANTDAAKALVREWATLQRERLSRMLRGEYGRPYREAWDQKVLQDVIEAGAVDGLKIRNLPWTYDKIADTPSGGKIMQGVPEDQVVIKQHQASRRNKKKV